MLRGLTRLYLLGLILGVLALFTLGRMWPPWLRMALLAGLVAQWAPVAVILALRWINPPMTAFMRLTQAELRELGQPDELVRTWVGEEGLSPEVRLAAVAGEDMYFARHSGFDWESLVAAYHSNRAGGPVRGGSTITQQTAKNLFLWEGRSMLRKVIEAYLTGLIEALWPKRRILEIYLNIAQFGRREFGVEAGAQAYFHKRARDLNAHEAALLMTVLPNPREYRADQPSHTMRYRQLMIVATMRKMGRGYLARLDALPRGAGQ